MTLSRRTQRALQALVLAGLGLFLLQQLWTGTLYWYLGRRFAVLVLVAVVACLALARTVLPGRAAADEARTGAPEREPASGSGWGVVLLALPLLLGLLIPAHPLGANAIASRGINVTVPLPLGGASPAQLELVSTERDVLEWVRAFDDSEDPQTYAGQAADVIGFVYHAPGLPADEFFVVQFVAACCAADAMAVGVLVRWPEAAALENDAWVRVSGRVLVGGYAERPTPLVAAETLVGVAESEQPYLLP